MTLEQLLALPVGDLAASDFISTLGPPVRFCRTRSNCLKVGASNTDQTLFG